MFTARLLVERGDYRSPSQDWGAFVFLSAPSPGDRVAVLREDGRNYLTVLSVHHIPVAVGQEENRPDPKAEVVARWTGADASDPD